MVMNSGVQGPSVGYSTAPLPHPVTMEFSATGLVVGHQPLLHALGTHLKQELIVLQLHQVPVGAISMKVGLIAPKQRVLMARITVQRERQLQRQVNVGMVAAVK